MVTEVPVPEEQPLESERESSQISQPQEGPVIDRPPNFAPTGLMIVAIYPGEDQANFLSPQVPTPMFKKYVKNVNGSFFCTHPECDELGARKLNSIFRLLDCSLPRQPSQTGTTVRDT